MAAVAHAATLDARIPFLHFFDGFRTSHELARIEELTDHDLRTLIAEPSIDAHRRRPLHTSRRTSARRSAELREASAPCRGAGPACRRITGRVSGHTPAASCTPRRFLPQFAKSF
jgi:pyruvate-ferredoxin/flavodoxin oxidoreductase